VKSYTDMKFLWAYKIRLEYKLWRHYLTITLSNVTAFNNWVLI